MLLFSWDKRRKISKKIGSHCYGYLLFRPCTKPFSATFDLRRKGQHSSRKSSLEHSDVRHVWPNHSKLRYLLGTKLLILQPHFVIWHGVWQYLITQVKYRALWCSTCLAKSLKIDICTYLLETEKENGPEPYSKILAKKNQEPNDAMQLRYLNAMMKAHFLVS